MKSMQEYDKDSILEKSVFEELYSITDDYDQADRLIALTERAYDFGKNCGDNFKKKARAYKKQIEKERKEKGNSDQRRETDFGYFEDGHELKCGNWIANSSGVLQYNPYGMANLACYHPILITQILKNAETKKQKVKLAFQVAGEWGEIVVDKGLIASASKITALAEYGINATSENAKYLVSYLADLENMNVTAIERKISTSKLGWINGDFIPYGMNVEFDSKEKFSELYDSVAEKGSYEKWMQCAKEVRKSGRNEPLVYMAGSFASILLEQLNLLSFVVNVWEESGGGKTVSQMLAASIWGDPRLGRFMTDISGTGTGVEVRSDVLNHLPLFVDDLSKIKEVYKDAFTDLVYAWCSGKGKDRSDQNLGLRRSCTWNNITLCSYERPLATENMRGGAVNRILDFQMDPGVIFTKEAGNATVSVITKNYGFAGKQFVNLVKEMGQQRIKALQQFFLQEIDQYCVEHDLEKEDKQKLPLSILLTADKLATDHIFKDGVYLDFEWCIKQLKGKDDVSENQRAYDAIMDDVAIHVNNFRPDDNGNYRSEFWGGIKNDYVYIIPSIFSQMGERYNFSIKAFLRWAKTQGLLYCDENKNQKTDRIPAGTNPRKFYAIKIRSEEVGVTGTITGTDEKSEKYIDGSGFVHMEEQIELPFD